MTRNNLIFYFKNKKAFTFIELLIIFAIIGVLTSIILVSLNDIKIKARAKNTRVMIAVNQSKPFAEMIRNDNGTYNTLCTSPDINTTTNGPYKDKLIIINDEITNNGGDIICYANGDSYCIYSQLNIIGFSVQYFCIDSTGNAITTTTDPDDSHCKAGSYICP